MKITPIFIFSLPRSGSTLLQKIIMSHTKIASISEPWILLPLLYLKNNKGHVTEYSQNTASKAIDDLINNLPNGVDDYNESIKLFSNNIYKKLCSKGEIYYLDKTPRYYLIMREIAEIYPDAKFIFLFRNPLEIYSSILHSFLNNNFFKLAHYDVDIKYGPKLLSDGYTLLKNKSLLVTYENLINKTDENLVKIFKYLELDTDIDEIKNIFFKKDLKGKMGDNIGTKKYNSISKLSLNKYKNTFNNIFRYYHIKNYIKMFDSEYLKLIDINKQNLYYSIKLKNINILYSIFDLINYFLGKINLFFKLNLFFGKNRLKNKSFLS